MRQSRYAVQAEGESGELLLYNTANGAFAQLSGDAATEWRALGGEVEAPAEDASLGEAPSQGGSGAFSAEAQAILTGCGFLTELSADDELQLQRDKFDRQRADASKLTLSFIPTYVCNFRCPYCYELGHNKIPGKMGARTMDAIMGFVDFKHAQDGFAGLDVQWYGGDPSLALDEVEQLSRRLIAWCEERGVAYSAMMLTNANVIDEQAADVIARCRISGAYLTIDGPEQLHNCRRVAANGSNSYERTIEAARLLRDRGVALFATMNTDKVNIAHYEGLRQKLLDEEGIVLGMGKLNDYGHFFGDERFCKPEFDLFTHEEFFDAQFAEFAKQPHDAAELREMLRPIRCFCTGQSDNYFIIDLLGDVYNCDGWVGDAAYVRFSLFDDPSTWKLREVTFDATRDAKCEACELLPVCLGSCIWERSCCGMPCHPFKTTIADYLRVYRQCFGERESDVEVDVLAEPFAAFELG